MNNSFRRRLFVACIGHSGLITSIFADYYRRSSEGMQSILLSGIGLIGLIIGAFLFIVNPHAFFVAKSEGKYLVGLPNAVLIMLAWVVVVGGPVLWLLATSGLIDLIFSQLIMRFVGAYLFFAWVASAIIFWPFLFKRKDASS